MTSRLTLNTTATVRVCDGILTKGPIAIARALNRSIASGKTVMVRLVANDLGLKQSDVRDKIWTIPATPDRQTAALTASAKRIPLIDFKHNGPEPSRGKGRGVTVRMPGGKGRYPKAFIAKMKTGHEGIFQRKAIGRLPIHELFGPSIAFVFIKHVAEGLARAQEQLAKNLAHELKFALQTAA